MKRQLTGLDPLDFEFERTCFLVAKQDAQSSDLSGIEWPVRNNSTKRCGFEFFERDSEDGNDFISQIEAVWGYFSEALRPLGEGDVGSV